MFALKMLILIAFDSCRDHVHFDVKISKFGKDPLNMVLIKHVSDDPTRKIYFMKTDDRECLLKLSHFECFYAFYIFMVFHALSYVG